MTDRERFVLLRDDREDRTVVFADPIAVVTVRERAGFEPAFAALQAAHEKSHWIAGFMSYEAGHLFEKKLAPLAEENRPTPLMSFGIFEKPAEDHPLATPRQRIENEPFLTEPKADWDFDTYRGRFDRRHQHLLLPRG